MHPISCSLLRKVQFNKLGILAVRNFSESYYQSASANLEPRDRLKQVQCNQSAIELSAAKVSDIGTVKNLVDDQQQMPCYIGQLDQCSC